MATDLEIQQTYFGQDVEVVSSLQANSLYASGLSYIPIAKNAVEQYLQFQFRAKKSGTLTLYVLYAMSVANGGDVVFRAEQLAVAIGEDPNAALAVGETFTFTPGNDANLKEAALATLFAVTQGEIVTIKLSRRDVAGDTHTGTFNYVGIQALIA